LRRSIGTCFETNIPRFSATLMCSRCVQHESPHIHTTRVHHQQTPSWCVHQKLIAYQRGKANNQPSPNITTNGRSKSSSNGTTLPQASARAKLQPAKSGITLMFQGFLFQ
jgi:hypothetical protein